MTPDQNKLKSTIIISVYTDHVALSLILNSLKQQTSQSFETIISEDGESDVIKKCVDQFITDKAILHLTQEDSGFRKNIALNRAIKSSSTDHLIFIDGDCVLHPKFIAAHQAYANAGQACTGRRLELGEKVSKCLRTQQCSFKMLTNRFRFILNIFNLQRDRAKNIECGLYSKVLSRLTKDRQIRLLGCNFSCHKQDLIKINGFNERYLSPGIGEDSDIDWRLVKSGVSIKNVKFSAIQYHLHHPRAYTVSSDNERLLKDTQAAETYTCSHGLTKSERF